MVLARYSSSSSAQRGFSLLEVMVATSVMTVGVLGLAQLFALSTTSNGSAKGTTFASVLASQKLEELRALTWGFDTDGLPMSDTTTNTAVSPETPTGGTGLTPSPATALQENTTGYVDYVDQFGNKVGAGTPTPASSALYIRRWSIEPLPTNPNNTLVIQVLVTKLRNRGTADLAEVKRLPDEARVMTVKTRKAQ